MVFNEQAIRKSPGHYKLNPRAVRQRQAQTTHTESPRTHICDGCCSKCGKWHGHRVVFCRGCCQDCGQCHGHVQGSPPGTKLSKVPHSALAPSAPELPQISQTIKIDLRFDEKLKSLFCEEDRDFLEECSKLSCDGMKSVNHWNYNRTSFFNMAPKNLKKIVEVGTQCGKNAYRIFKVCRPQHLFLIDPWDRTVEDPQHIQNTDLEMQRLSENCTRMFFDNKENVTIMKNWSLEAVDLFNNEELDFVYIDGDHAVEAVYQDLCKWSDKVRSGGFLGGHDFENHLISAVNDFIKTREDFELCYSPYVNNRFSSDSSDSHSDFLLIRI